MGYAERAGAIIGAGILTMGCGAAVETSGDQPLPSCEKATIISAEQRAKVSLELGGKALDQVPAHAMVIIDYKNNVASQSALLDRGGNASLPDMPHSPRIMKVLVRTLSPGDSDAIECRFVTLR